MKRTTGELVYRVPKMHSGQKEIFRHPARFKWLAAGRRWRKTTLAMRVALRCASAGESAIWGAPTFRQCRIGWSELYTAAGGVAEFHRGNMEAVVPPGKGIISFVSLDNPDSARGKAANIVIVDEAGYVTEMAWQEVLRPMLSDTGGAALIMGTPRGRNWFWRESIAAVSQPDSAAWQVPTLGVQIVDNKLVRKPHPLENSNFPFAEAERMYQSMPQRIFEQEFLAEFMDDVGLVFRNVDAVSMLSPCAKPTSGHKYTFGVDWARAYDWTVISVIDATGRAQVAVERFNKIDYQFQLGRLEAMYNLWQPDMIVAEANAMGTPLIEQLQRRGMPVQSFTTTAQSKADIIEGLALAIERGEIKLLKHEQQAMELKAFGLERLPGGSFRYGAPSGIHDDMVIALALAWRGIAGEARPASYVVNLADRVDISPY